MDAKDYLTTKQLEGIDLLKAQILTPIQKEYYSSLFTLITLNNAECDLTSPTSEDRKTNELRRAFDSGKRAMLLELLMDSDNATLEMRDAEAALAQQYRNS